MRTLSRLFFVALCWFAVTARAVSPVIGNPDAPKGGTLTFGLPGYPKALLFYLAFEETALTIDNLVLEPLLELHPETGEPTPLLAAAWTLSPDKKVFTFTLDAKARFSDGKPVTADDVTFTWDTLMSPKNKTTPFQAYFGSFASCTAVDPHTVRFEAKEVHFKNLEKFGAFFVLPRHFFGEGDFNKAFANRMLGSGPYVLDEVSPGNRIAVKRNPKYWGASLPQNRGRYNFDRIVFKVVPDYNVQFELFKKGDIDYFYFLSSKMWTVDTRVPVFEKGYVKKLKLDNQSPPGTQGIAWNLRRPLFADRNVRLALSLLLDREKIVKDLLYDNFVPTAGVVSVSSEFHAPGNKPLPYDPRRAKKLLIEAGWKPGPDGVLVKGKTRFEFELTNDNPSYLKYLTVYQQALKKMGIKMNIRTVDWATRIRLLDDRNFDAADIAREREAEPSDFGVMWSSDQADRKGGANSTGYKNPEVDALCKKIDETFDRAERLKLVRRLDTILSGDQPMTFSWELKYVRLGYRNRFAFPGKGYFKYSTWRDAFHYWWYDAAKDAKLQSAVASGKSLPE